MNFSLLERLCSIQAPSGSEYPLTEFLVRYIQENASSWKNQPIIHKDGLFQDSLVLVFGKPTTAIFAHIDSIGFTAGYGSQLIKIGGPVAEDGFELVGVDSQGGVEATINLLEDEEHFSINYVADRAIDRGTTLTFKPDFRVDDEFVQCCYMDNRLGVFNALKVAETLENGIICFSTYEEHGGGNAQFLADFILKEYSVHQALISDITWVTSGVQHGNGVAISMRDSGIPRKKFLNRIIDLAKASGVPFQLEVESAGGSDGSAIQKSVVPMQWCFIGAPEDHVHSPNEKVAISDIEAMISLYEFLMARL